MTVLGSNCLKTLHLNFTKVSGAKCATDLCYIPINPLLASVQPELDRERGPTAPGTSSSPDALPSSTDPELPKPSVGSGNSPPLFLQAGGHPALSPHCRTAWWPMSG